MNIASRRGAVADELEELAAGAGVGFVGGGPGGLDLGFEGAGGSRGSAKVVRFDVDAVGREHAEHACGPQPACCARYRSRMRFLATERVSGSARARGDCVRRPSSTALAAICSRADSRVSVTANAAG